MRVTAPERRAPYVERLTLALILPRYVILGHIALMGSFGMVILSVMGVMHFNRLPTNPFAAYVAVRPGQPSSELAGHGFTCSLSNYNYSRDTSKIYCRKTSKTDVFSSVEVVYSGGVIHHLSFNLRDSRFNVGEIILLLNLSELRPHRNVVFTWRGNLGVAQIVRPSAHFSMLQRVSQVTLTDARLTAP